VLAEQHDEWTEGRRYLGLDVLAWLDSPLLRVVAVRGWARTMRSPMGELCFAAHARHAEAEMRALGHDVMARITGSPALSELLRP
jgi:hypothetical protein